MKRRSRAIVKEEKAIDRAVGAKLRRFRESRGMTQEALGDAVEITFQQIQKYEKGTNRISASRLQQFAEVFGCHPGDFFEGISASGETSPIPTISAEVIRYGEVIAAISSDAVRRDVVRLATTLAQEQPQ